MGVGFFVSPCDLWALIGTADAPRILDVRPPEVYEASSDVIPGSIWRDPAQPAALLATVARDRRTVVACSAGHALSQGTSALLREQGLPASTLAGGYSAWRDAGLPLVDRAAVTRFAPTRPSLWVTRRRPKIDRVACPWLIRRFIDSDARFLFVDPPQVSAVARESGATPFDIEGIALSHEGACCTFDTMLKLFNLDTEPSLARLAPIVRGADTARPDLAPEAAGLHAVSLGLSVLAGDDDHDLLSKGFAVYDALFAWLRFAAEERHNWPAQAA